MFQEYLPQHTIGFLLPLAVVDNAAYEFYRLVPKGLMAVMVPIGLSEFSARDVERVFEPLPRLLDQLQERGVEIVCQSGTPLAILIGTDAHDRLLDKIASHTGLPATSTTAAVCRAAAHLGLGNIALANKWSEPMNAVLSAFFRREGVGVCGTTTEVLAPAEFVKIGTGEHMQLAYGLGRRALIDNPDCDGVYLGGGAWISAPAAERLEQEFGKPVICNQTGQLWDFMRLLNTKVPTTSRGTLLTTM
jgi:maleate isomerase